jgi:two-component system, OmpR family, phosphate regulon response regulator OmpR
MLSEAGQNPNMASRPHVLVVDDDNRIRSLLSRFLAEKGFVVITAADAAEAGEMLRNFQFDILVVDVMMPGESGLSFTKGLGGDKKIPVLLLTALGETSDRIAGFEAGADDYLPKPFEPRELVLRINAILRRASAGKLAAEKPFRVGRWRFDPELSELQNGSEVLQLTAAESTLIKALAAHAGQPVSRDELARQCGLNAGERTIDVQVTRLRRKIEENTRLPRTLQTVRGKGYLLRVEDL